MRSRKKAAIFLVGLLVLASALLPGFLPLRMGSAETGSSRLYSVSTVVIKGAEVTQHWQSHASNNSYYQIDAVKVGAQYSVDVEMVFSTTVDPTTLSNITVFSEAHVAATGSPVDIQIYDYFNAIWVPCFSVSSTIDTNHTTTFSTNLANYVNTTLQQMKLQVFYQVKLTAQSIYQDHTYIELIPKLKPPVASFAYSPSKPIVNQNVTFNASASYDPDGTIVSWDWNFGDGYTSSGEVVTHAYTTAGTYNVTLTVTDNDTLTDTDWQLIEVYIHDVAVISVTPSATKVSVGETLTIDVVVENQGTASESFTVTTYRNETAIGTEPVTLNPGANTTVSFLWDTTGVALGNYTIKAEASVVPGETDTGDNIKVDGIVAVQKGPVASFTISPDPPYFVGDILTFNASSSTPDGGELIDPDSYSWDFGDLTTGTGKIVTHAYTAPANYTVTLTITDTEGLSDTATAIVVIKKYPVASFIYSPEAPIVNQDVTFDASSSAPDGGVLIDPDSYSWDFGDLTTGTGKIVVHAFAAAGIYNVTLTVTDTEGLSDSTWELVTVYIHDVAVISVTPSATEVSVGETLTIDVVVENQGTASESFTVTAYYDSYVIGTQPVSLGPGATTTIPFPWDTTGVALGNYTIKANATVVLGETDIADNEKIDGTVTIEKYPVASFTYEPVAPAVGQDVTFNASSSAPDGGVLIDPDSYSWDFGDLTTGTGMIVTHAFAAEGTYNVSLTVTDTEGLSDSTWQLVEVYLHDVAVISVVPSKTKVIVGETVTIDVVVENQGTVSESFTVTAYYDGNIIETKPVSLGSGAGTTLSFTWDTTGVLPGFNYTIKAEASVVPGETVPDQGDNTKVDGDVWVTDYPTASFTISPDPTVVDVFPGDLLTFDASGSTSNGGTIISWDWDWGDGTPHGTLEIDTHIYATQGTYIVTLTVTDSEGLSDSTSKSVPIKGNPVARFTISPDPTVVDVYSGETLTFNASDSTPDGGTIVSWDWDFGDLSTGSGEVVTHAYATAGTYTVTLTVTDSENLSNSTSKTFTIKGLHDVAVLDVTPVATEAYPTWWPPLSINVTVANQGDLNETFSVTVYYNLTATQWVAIETLTVTNLTPGTSTILTFNWDLLGLLPPPPQVFVPITPTIKANATIVSGETDTGDNEFIDGTVYIKVPGDANGDQVVDIIDLGMLGGAWGLYDPRVDFNNDGIIDIIDLGILGGYWGYPWGG